jgi:cell division transport system ATP-binding protein
MVRFDRVGLRYGSAGGQAGPEVLHDLSFTLPDGAFRWLLGPSGAGKTSVLRLMYLDIRPSRGHLNVLDTDIGTAARSALPRLRRRIGVVFQDFRLLSHLSAFDNVALPLRIAGRPEAQIRADVTEMLRWVGLARKHEVRPPELSGGEQQRVAIARAFIAGPKLLLADEPTGSLDSQRSREVLELLRELCREREVAVVLVSHDPQAASYADRVLALRDGKLTDYDPEQGFAPTSSAQGVRDDSAA